MKLAVLCDGAGLARLGLERAGHDCTGFELDPVAHYLSLMVGSGRSILADVKAVDLSGFDGVWTSPPCQYRSKARTQGDPRDELYADPTLLDWSLELPHKTLWVENVPAFESRFNTWGKLYNAAQFTEEPLQNRNRIVGGRYPEPATYRPYRKFYPDICPCITATEYKGCATDARRASRYYGRRLRVEDCAYHQGFIVPEGWLTPLPGFTPSKWRERLYKAIGNGVPVYMAEAFGRAVA